MLLLYIYRKSDTGAIKPTVDNPPLTSQIALQMKYPESYRNAHKLQQLAYSTAFNEKTEPCELSKLIKAWLDLEWFKREARGLPRLKAADLLANMKRLPSAQRSAASSPIEITSEPQVDKESLKNASEPTVTAPPSQTPHCLEE